MMADNAGPALAPQKRWAVFYLATVVAMMALQMSSLGFSPLLPAIQHDFQMSFSQMGLFTGIYGLVALVVSVPAGILAKQYGEKRILVIGMAILALGLFSLSFAENYGQGLTARALWIFGYRLAFVCVMTAIALTAPPHLKGRAMGILGACSALATVLGAPFCAGLAEAFGWRHAVMGFGAMTIVGLVIFSMFYKQRPEVVTGRNGPKSQGAFSAFKYPIVWTIPLLGLTNAGGFAATFFLPSVLKADFQLGPSEAAGVISMSYILAIVVNPLCGWLADRYNRWMVLAGMMMLMVPACLAMTSHNHPDARQRQRRHRRKRWRPARRHRLPRRAGAEGQGPAGHKVALRPIAQGEAILRYNVAIGYALRDIEPAAGSRNPWSACRPRAGWTTCRSPPSGPSPCPRSRATPSKATATRTARSAPATSSPSAPRCSACPAWSNSRSSASRTSCCPSTRTSTTSSASTTPTAAAWPSTRPAPRSRSAPCATSPRTRTSAAAPCW
jgi:predicted MFS family arabinose efflux permease